MLWRLAHRYDAQARAFAERHYNRQQPGAQQFVSPGRLLVLVANDGGAAWVSVWPRWVKHAWPDHWVNTLFRREHGALASDLIRDAIAATRWRWGDPPRPVLTFVAAESVRHKRDPGRCYLRAGFRLAGRTVRRGRLAFVLDAADLPAACPPDGAQLALFSGVSRDAPQDYVTGSHFSP